MNLREFLEILDQMFPVIPEQELVAANANVHELHIDYTLADPDPQRGWE